jgi:NADH-quinone oxidoreductase subunit H
MKFAVFFMGEYAAMLLFSAIFSTVFLGGWDVTPFAFTSGLSDTTIGGLAAFFGKSAFIFTVFIWMRATLPRLRYDQLMSLGWRTLLPVGVANFMVVAVWIVWGWVAWALAAGVIVVLYLGIRKLSTQRIEDSLASRTVELVNEPARRTVTLVETPTEAAPAN